MRTEKWADYTELKRKILTSLHNDKWDRLASTILLKEDKLRTKTEIIGVEFSVELYELANSQEDPITKTEKFK